MHFPTLGLQKVLRKYFSFCDGLFIFIFIGTNLDAHDKTTTFRWAIMTCTIVLYYITAVCCARVDLLRAVRVLEKKKSKFRKRRNQVVKIIYDDSAHSTIVRHIQNTCYRY